MHKAHTHSHLSEEADTHGEGETEPHGIQDVLVDAIVTDLECASWEPIVPQIGGRLENGMHITVNPRDFKALFPNVFQFLRSWIWFYGCVCAYHFTVPRVCKFLTRCNCSHLPLILGWNSIKIKNSTIEN